MVCNSRYACVVTVLLIPFLLLSCGFERNTPESTTTQKTISTEASESNADSDISQKKTTGALITFLTGEIRHISSGTDRSPEIGDRVHAGDRLETGIDGYIELQFGNLGVLRIQADSSYQLESVNLTDESEKVSGTLGSGSVLAKIRRLTNKDGFEVNVPGAVCAVRGTEFLIRADEYGSVMIAVADGSVSVAPLSLAEVTGRIETDEDLAEIRMLMPLVTANNEILINSDTFIEIEQELTVFTSGESVSEESETSKERLVLFESRIKTALIDVPEPEPIRTENAEVLKEETPQILTVVYDSGTDDSVSIPALVTLTIITEPSDAGIFINNRFAGYGSASRVFSEGSPVSILTVSKDGRRVEKELLAGSESLVNIVFDKSESQTELDTVPETESEPQSGPAESAEKEEPEVSIVPLAVPVAIVVVESPVERVQRVAELSINVKPADAAIFINGERAGTGSYNFEGKPGDQLIIRVARPGYAGFSQNVILSSDSPPFRVNLEPVTIVSEVQLPDIPAVGSLVTSGDIVVGATARGTLYALNRSGRLIWTRTTNNRDGENITPVISGNRVYMTGNSELVIVNIDNGRIITRRELIGDQADLFGRRIVVLGKQFVLPSDSSLLFRNPENVKASAEITIPGGSRMTPVIWNHQILIANQRGSLLYIDPETKSIVRTVDTGVSQPIGQAPTISRNVAVFTGRRGTVTAVDLHAARVIWEHPLDDEGFVRVHTDAVINNGIVYVYRDGTLFSMNLENGETQFPPIPGVSAPPMVRNGILYLCRSDGILSMHDQRNGSFLGEFI